MTIFGLSADVQNNPNRNVQLFVPGESQLGANDVFLGGEGTGVTDSMIGPALRIYGDDRNGTTRGLENYLKDQPQDPFSTNDTKAQMDKVIANNNAPRSDWAQGRPGMGRLAMEQKQVQDAVSNAQNAAQLTGDYNNAPTLAKRTYDQNVKQDAINSALNQDKFDYGKTQDAFTNEFNVGKMMANYKGQDTYEKRADAIKNAQFDKTLDYNAYNDAANRNISQQNTDISRQNADNNELAAGITRTGGGTYSGVPEKFWSEASSIGSAAGVDPLLLAAIAQHETGFGALGAGRDGFALGVGVYDKGNPNSNYQDANGTYTKQLTWAANSLANKFSGDVTEANIKAYQDASGYATDPAWAKGVYNSYQRLKATETAGTKTIGTKSSDKINPNELIGRLNTMYTTKDSSSGEVVVNPDTKAQLRAAIIGQGLSDSETDKMLLYYGLPVNK